ncbi:hypothetical protein Ddye_008280 [Dipteronia dyeriana]|uniref:Uncharacterized protein n=1 Tax=Dipteronia dyeriana TaxID=168575 RepID=A0AAE0CLR8_9ROSI|nr:hypothetical protein Ddye_008280 [Dipteronia dyeriana]
MKAKTSLVVGRSKQHHQCGRQMKTKTSLVEGRSGKATLPKVVAQNQREQAPFQEKRGKGLERLIDRVQVPVAAVVVMACNRADYLERTINSILKSV